MFNSFKKWCHKWPGLAVLLVFALILIVIAFGILGFIGKMKLDAANTNLWTARQTISELREDARAQASEYEAVIQELQEELAALKDANAINSANNIAEAATPKEVYKVTGTGELSISSIDNPNVRRAPEVSDVSFGKMASGNFTLEYFYCAPRLPQEGIGNWVGIPVHLLSESELRLFPDGVTGDKDGVIWVSADYLKFSDWLKNYPATKVNLQSDIALESAKGN